MIRIISLSLIFYIFLSFNLNLLANSWYVQGGTSFFLAGKPPEEIKYRPTLENVKSSYGWDIKFGKQYQTFSWEIERSAFHPSFQELNDLKRFFTVNASHWSINAVNIFILENMPNIFPYICAGIGYIISHSRINDHSDFSITYQLMTGVQFKINDIFFVDFGYKFSFPMWKEGLLGTPQFIKQYDIKSDNHFLTLGLRFFL